MGNNIKIILIKIKYLLKNKWWGMLLLSAIPFLIILGPLLFFGKIFFNGDILSSQYPLYHFYQNSLQQKMSIFWNPYNFSGFPTFISSMIFLSPLQYLFFKLFSVFTAFNLIIFFNVTLAAFFTAKLLQKFNLSYIACLIGGLTYVFSQWNWISDLPVCNVLPILPLLFLLLWQAKHKKSHLPVILGGVTIGWAWLSVHFNWMPIILTAGLFFSLFLNWQDSKRIKIPFKFLLMVLIGTIIGLIILVPAFIYLSLSSRFAGLSYDQAAISPIVLGDFIHYFLPYFQLPFLKLVSINQLYLGILPLYFLILAISFKKPLAHFFSFLFLFTFLLSIDHSPLFWLLQKLPIFRYLRAPTRWMFIGSFAAAILVSFGTQEFFNKTKEYRQKFLLELFKWTGIVFLFIFSFGSLIFLFLKDRLFIFAVDYFDRYIYPRTSGLPIDYYHQIIKTYIIDLGNSISFLNPRLFFPLIFIFISYFILIYFYKKKEHTNFFFPVVFLVILFNFLLVFVFYHPIFSSKIYSRRPETVKFLSEQPPGRIFSFLPGFTEYNKLTAFHRFSPKDSFIFQSELLTPNFNLLYGLESIDYYDNLMSRRMARILALLGSDRAIVGEKLSDLKILPEKKAEILKERKKLLDFLGVRYVLSAFPLPAEGFNKIFETKIPPYEIPLAIYGNSAAKPLVYFVKNLEIITSDEDVAFDKLITDLDRSESFFIECQYCPLNNIFDGKGEILIKEKKNNLINLTTISKSEQFLIFSQNNLPGWQSHIDGQKTQIYTVNSVYMGILIPAGQHQVSFRFTYLNLMESFKNIIKNNLIFN